MSLAALKEVTVSMGKMNYSFSEQERQFVAWYAFRSRNREKTEQLIEELSVAKNEQESAQIMERYKSDCETETSWVEQVENLLIALEVYRVEQEKAAAKVAEILTAYGIDMTAGEISHMKTEEIKAKVRQEKEVR